MNRLTSLLATLPLAAGLVLVGGVVTAPAASADPGVTVRNDQGGSSADLTYRTTFTVSGSGFQSVRGGFGGVYVAFGWVRDPGGGSWKPSRGGTSGADYRYVPDSETGSNNGYLRFVAFPGSSTAGEAHAVMGAGGGFEVPLTVPGPVFSSLDRDGNASEVDCREVTCGVITIGAHGVKNPRNESFTPVDFAEVYDAAPDEDATSTPDAADGPSSAASGAGGSAGTGGAGAAAGGAGRVRVGKPRVAVDRPSAQAGHAMAFTAGGFTPGEQVVAVLDDGVVSLGPMTAGASGEVAGVLPLPDDIGAGTHVLRLSGAASGLTPRQRFPIAPTAAPAASSAATGAADEPAAAGLLGRVPLSLVFLLLATLVLLAALGWQVRRRVRARRTRTGARAEGPSLPPTAVTS